MPGLGSIYQRQNQPYPRITLEQLKGSIIFWAALGYIGLYIASGGQEVIDNSEQSRACTFYL